MLGNWQNPHRRQFVLLLKPFPQVWGRHFQNLTLVYSSFNALNPDAFMNSHFFTREAVSSYTNVASAPHSFPVQAEQHKLL